jgi:sulfatase maturation enzyme AslB (radical SAM superfamily)
MILPPNYNYIEAYITLRCNLDCQYCINKASNDLNRKREELSSKEWLCFFNKIESNINITIGGGEPTLHKDFYEIVTNSTKNLDLLTNLSFNINDFINNLSESKQFTGSSGAYKRIRVSYHPKSMDPEILILKCVDLQNAGYSIGLFGINHPENMEANIYMSEYARKNEIYFFIKDFLGNYNNQLFGYYKYPNALDGKNKKCKCRSNELLIGPDGNVYRCHRDLYTNENEIGNILEEDLEIDNNFKLCNNYGSCNPCDVKAKTNRFLQAGSCSVEIKE